MALVKLYETDTGGTCVVHDQIDCGALVQHALVQRTTQTFTQNRAGALDRKARRVQSQPGRTTT
ncbi:hypothetical protein ACFT1A_29510 [Rhodococcus sp. NPDC057135]|uniref:hypothetical protein n=1 Tax=Rhodococcus sp. NPDC057135 TaxID=3346028 RepID=UPI0036455FE5